MRSFSRLFSLVLISMALSSCIALKKDVDVAKADIKAEQNAKIKVMEQKITQEVAKISKRLDEIEKTLKIDKKAQQNKINLSFTTLDDLKATIRDINNRIDMVDVNAQKGDGVNEKIAELEKKLEEYKTANEKLADELTAKLDDLKPVENFTVTETGRVRLPDDIAKTYKQLVKFTRSNSDGVIARKAWELFSKKFKNKRQCDVVYWIGETYFLEKSYNKAIEYFSQIDSKYSKCSKLEASYLRTAESLYHIGKNDVALKVLKVLKMKYPKTSFAKDIKNLEEKIRKAPQKGKTRKTTKE